MAQDYTRGPYISRLSPENDFHQVLWTTKNILEAYKNNETFNLIVQGPPGWGKSAFAIKVLSEVYGKKELIQTEDGEWVLFVTKPYWDAWKKYMVFTPRQYGWIEQKAIENGFPFPCIVRDDAGVWESAYRWTNPYNQSVAEGTDLQRMTFTSVIRTTLKKSHILARIRNLPDMHTGIVKKQTAAHYTENLRALRVYSNWESIDGRKEGVRGQYEDVFSRLLPERVFQEYSAVRESYNDLSHKLQERQRNKLYNEQGIDEYNTLEETLEAVKKSSHFAETMA
ncbi:MAG: hypothetical protein ACYCQJ_12915 [Nitrososphaerales archaeon]